MLGRLFLSAALVLGAGSYTGSAQGQSSTGEDQREPSTSTKVEDSPARQQAKRLYEEGLSAYRARKYSDAIDKLLEADRLMPNAAFSYNIALVYEAMGDQRSALRWLRSHLRQRGDESAELATLTKVGKLEKEMQVHGVQQVTILSKPPGATVWIDGHSLGLTPFTTEIVPGSHSVSLALNGHEPAQRAFELRADRAMDVEVELTASPITVPPDTKPQVQTASSVALAGTVSPAPPSTLLRSRVQPWTWVGLGVGTALFGGAVFFEVKRQKEEDQARSAPSQRDYLARLDDMESSQKVARVLAVAGSLTMATSLTLLAIDLTRQVKVETATLGSCATPGLCVTAGGRF